SRPPKVCSRPGSSTRQPGTHWRPRPRPRPPRPPARPRPRSAEQERRPEQSAGGVGGMKTIVMFERVRRAAVRAVTVGVVAAMGVGAGGIVTPSAAATKVKPCTIVPQAQLEQAVGNAFDTPQDSSLGSISTSCRFPSADVSGADLNLFVSTDVKGGIKDSIAGSYFATKKSFTRVYGSAAPVKGIGKQAYTAFDGSSSVPQGSLLVLVGKNHAV